ncbi:MAG: hypothetical protein JWN79_2069 [Gemmatimonadetes bacterium]|jgi:hypothetical protein|nr:hypothetical protein [Gemmatimonadota bacterium]
MIRRSLVTAALALVAAAPLSAQMAGMNHDPDKATGGGALPAGWSSRKDRESAPDAKVERVGTGLHVTSGAAAIYWMEKQKAGTPFSVSASFTQLKAPSHPEAYGLFFMGSKLTTPEQSYAYFLVRGDGKVTVKHRAGAEVHTITDWTENAAVHKQDASGKATNVLSVVAAADSTRMLVNGVQIAALAASYAKADGYVGLRVNHNLDVRVDDFTVKAGAGSARAKAAPKKAAKLATKKS